MSAAVLIMGFDFVDAWINQVLCIVIVIEAMGSSDDGRVGYN